MHHLNACFLTFHLTSRLVKLVGKQLKYKQLKIFVFDGQKDHSFFIWAYRLTTTQPLFPKPDGTYGGTLWPFESVSWVPETVWPFDSAVAEEGLPQFNAVAEGLSLTWERTFIWHLFYRGVYVFQSSNVLWKSRSRIRLGCWVESNRVSTWTTSTWHPWPTAFLMLQG